MPKLIVVQIEYVKLIFAEMKALATGDGLLIEKVEVESNLSRFYALRTQYNTECGWLKYELSQLPARITHLRQVVKGYEQACARLEAVQDGEFSMKVNGRIYTERQKAGKTLMGTAVAPLQPGDQLRYVGELWGFRIHTERTLSKRLAWLEVGERLQVEVELGESPVGNVAKLMNALKGMPGILDNKRLQLEKWERQLPQYEQRVALPFEHAAQVEKLETRLREIEVTIENRYKEALAEETDEAKKSQAAYQARVKQERAVQAANGSAAVSVKGAEEMRKVIERLLANSSLLDEFRNNELFYLKLENGPYMPLVIERLIDRVSVAHYNDDGQADPDILFRLSDWVPEEITQLTTVMAGQVLGGYEALVDENHRPIPPKVKDVVKFTRVWAKNIKNQGWLEGATVGSHGVG